MYENGNKKRINIDLPSFNMPKFPKRKGNNDRRTILTIISRFSMICLFFFIFIFCVSRFGKVINVSHAEPDFNSNLTYIQKRMIKYYDSGNVPQKVGDSSSLTLGDLISKNIINKKKIQNVDTCDKKNSYVKLTKTRDKVYNLKVSLTCDGIVEEYEDVIKNI